MSVLSEDASRFRDFDLAGESLGGDPFRLTILERSRTWSQPQLTDATSVAVLEQWDQQRQIQNDFCDLRIILAPLDISLQHSRAEFLRLFGYLGVPSAFVSERLQSVRHSFGARRDGHNVQSTWFHFLCRRPNGSYQEAEEGSTTPLSLWDRFGMFMNVNQPQAPKDGQPGHRPPGVSITLFGAGDDLAGRMKALWNSPQWIEVLEDPYILIDVILDELYLQMDRNVQDVSRLFGSIESKVINSTESPGQAASEIDFRILHNISKDAIYLEESFDSIIKTAESISQYHHTVLARRGAKLSLDVQDGLEYRRSILVSSRLQVRSLQNRVQNLIGLSFHLTTQAESLIFKQDSFSMHALALVSLLFVPLASVSSFLGTPFFTVPDSKVVNLNHGPNGIMLGVGAATVIVFVLWLGWYWSARMRLKKGALGIRNRFRGASGKRKTG